MSWNNTEKLYLLIPKGDGLYVYSEERVISTKTWKEATTLRFKFSDPLTGKRRRVNLVVYKKFETSEVLSISESWRGEIQYGDFIVSRSGKEELMKKYSELMKDLEEKYKASVECFNQISETLKTL